MSKNLSSFKVIQKEKSGENWWYVEQNGKIVAGGFATKPSLEITQFKGKDEIFCIVPSLSGNDELKYIL